MEGPSLVIATEQLAPFIKKKILSVNGNTKIGKERLQDLMIQDIFSWGKHLIFQFKEFALKIHFLLFGSFEAIVKGIKVTGDYPAKNRLPRLQLILKNGEIDFYSCSLKYLEDAQVKNSYDYSIDIMSPSWNPKKALEKIRKKSDQEVGDVLLDQEIFSGVGNIIKNEVLYITKTHPSLKVNKVPLSKLKEIIKTTKSFSLQFYKWRKKFVLRAHYKIYRQRICPHCKQKIQRKKTGLRNRVSFFCPDCQNY